MGYQQNRQKSGHRAGKGIEREDRCRQNSTLHRAPVAVLALAFLTLCAPQNPSPADLAPLFDGERAFALLKAQVALGPRYPGSEGHIKMRDWLVNEAKKYTSSVTLQEFKHTWSVTKKELTLYNVIAEIQVGAPKTILLLAHWDTRPTADQDPDPSKRKQPILGANDGASGVAVLLELMRVFKEKPPPVNITFLFTDGEDLGPSLDEMFLGASHFAKNAPRNQYAYGILLDMVGDKDLVIEKEAYSVFYAKDLVERFWKHARSIGLGAYFVDRVGTWIADDHLPLNQVGIPTIDLIDFDYPAWHTTNDTPEQCSPASLSVVGRAVESFLRNERNEG